MELRLRDSAALRHDEALLTFRGVTAGRVIEPETLIVDVGGGSTELVLGGPDGVSFHTSLDLGCVRLTERFGDDIEACAAHVRSELPDLEPRSAIGVAGTVTALAALDLGLVEYDADRVHGHVLTRTGVEASSSGWPRCRSRSGAVPGLEPERAPVIVAGAVIVREVLARYGLDSSRRAGHPPRRGARGCGAACRGRRRSSARRLHLLLMRYGLVLSNIGSFSKPENVVELAEAAEEAAGRRSSSGITSRGSGTGRRSTPGSRSAESPPGRNACCSAPA